MSYFGSYLWDTIGLLTALVVVGYTYFRWKLQYWKRKNIPHLEPVFPWGNIQNPFNRIVSEGEAIVGLYNKARAKGLKYCGIQILATPVLMINDLDLIKQVMTKDFSNFVDRGVYYNEKDDPLSAHLFAVGGKKWKNLRAKLSPTFTSGKLKNMFQTLVDCGLVLEKYIEAHVHNVEGADIKDILGKFSTDIIGSCAFGLDCNSFKDPNSPFRVYGKKVFDRTTLENATITFVESFPNIGIALGIPAFQKDVTNFFMNIVEDTVNYRRKNNVTRNDFLQLILELLSDKEHNEDGYEGDGRKLTMNEAAAQSFVFFLAGFETSSTTMTFALYEMALHQDVQDKVRDEIRVVLGKQDNKINYDSLSELKYMKQVIDETLRKYSPVPFVTRVSGSNYKLPGEDIVIEKGTKVLIPILGIHRDTEYYENPMEFNPDRFSDQNKVGRHAYAHIPFGEGPRICIGERFGIMQTKVGLTSLLRNYKVTVNKKTAFPLKLSTNSFVPAADGGVWLNFERVKF